MRKVVLIWLTAFVAAIGAAAVAVGLFVSPRFGDSLGHDGLADVALSADAQVEALEPAGLTPGSAYSYKIEIVNEGRFKVDDFTVRSEKVVGGRAGDGLDAYSAVGAACSVGARVDCVVSGLEPGERREIRIEAASSARRAAGDSLRIHTYVGRFKPNGAAGGLDYDIVSRSETGGAFVATASG